MPKFNGTYNGEINGIIRILNPEENPFVNVENAPIILNFTENGKDKYTVSGSINFPYSNLSVSLHLAGVAYYNNNTHVLKTILDGSSVSLQLSLAALINMNITSLKRRRWRDTKNIQGSVELLSDGTAHTHPIIIGSAAFQAKIV